VHKEELIKFFESHPAPVFDPEICLKDSSKLQDKTFLPQFGL